MGEKTGIAWTDHSFNPWVGCTKVSAGCANCYAERENARFGWNKNGWGDNAPRIRTSENNWKQPIKWAKQAVKDGVTRRVFCASLADVFDPLVPAEWRTDLWSLMLECGEWHGGLEWLILTKRPENIFQMLPLNWQAEPPDYVRIGVTVENKYSLKRVDKLLSVWQGKNFVSYEPALARVDFSYHLDGCPVSDKVSDFGSSHDYIMVPTTNQIGWMICGCESGPGARPMNPDWARSVLDKCIAADVPFLLKQMVIDGKLVREPELDGKQWLQFPKESVR